MAFSSITVDQSRKVGQKYKRDSHGQGALSHSPTQFPEAELEKIQDANEKAETESTPIAAAFLPYIAGTTNILSQGDVVFNNLQGCPMGLIKDVKPDSYETRSTC